MSGLSGEESPQEKEERLQSREDRLGKQHARLQERGSGHDNLSIGGGGGGGAGRLGGQKPTGESFIGEHKVGIFVAAGVVVLAFYLWTAHTNSSTSPQDALAGGTATPPAGSTGSGPNVGTTNDAGTTYGINQLTQQLAAIQTSLTNSLNGTPATGSANLPAANGGGGPQSLIAIATPDATNTAMNPTLTYTAADQSAANTAAASAAQGGSQYYQVSNGSILSATNPMYVYSSAPGTPSSVPAPGSLQAQAQATPASEAAYAQAAGDPTSAMNRAGNTSPGTVYTPPNTQGAWSTALGRYVGGS